MKWFPKAYMVSLDDIGEMNFAKKQRGKKPVQGRYTIPFNLTRRQCVSKVAEMFDLYNSKDNPNPSNNEIGPTHFG